MAEPIIVSWDWREQIDTIALRQALADLAGSTIRLYNVDTGTDEYAIVLADRDLTDAEVKAAWEAKRG